MEALAHAHKDTTTETLTTTSSTPKRMSTNVLQAQGTQLSTVMFSVETLKEVLSLAQKNDEPGVVRYCLNGACGRGAHAGDSSAGLKG